MKYFQNMICKTVVHQESHQHEIIRLFEENKKTYSQVQKTQSGKLKRIETQKEIQSIIQNFQLDCLVYCANMQEVANYLVEYVYGNKKENNKALLWLLVGKYIYQNIMGNTGNKIVFPIKSVGGDIEYLGETFDLEKIDIV